MKKMTFFACAAMLASAVAFTGCNNEENAPQQNAANVTTDLAISLPSQVGGPMRMPGTTVQTNGQADFGTNSMKTLTLIPFAKSAKVTGTSTRLGEDIVLGALPTMNQNAAGRTAVFENRQVPQGTSAFLFYAESGINSNTKSEYFTKGRLNASLTGQPADINFGLERIVLNESTVTTDTAYVGLVNYMNLVANATDENGVAWKEYTSAQNEGYAQMFATYSTATALNSVAIQRMMDDLYKSLALNTVDSLAKAIRKAILDSHYATLESGDVTLVAGLQNFPQRLSLPAGAFTVAYDGTNKAFGANGAASYGGFSTAAVNSYVYPASLWYYANTKIKTSNTSEKDHYVANASWASILGAYANDDASVNTLTRSIALKDTIQYAVARLDVKVKTKANNYLEDNDPIAANNKVENPTNGYQVTAVLVGNQHNVGFDFTPESYQGSDAVYFTIFDSIMPTNMKTSTEAYSAINSTLVLESEAGDSASNIAKDVYVAIELINSSTKDFYGAGGCIIPMGSRFYLVGKLESKKSTVKDADNNIIQRVFIQDYTTTAAFSIKDLKNAYNTIPDLRAPQLEIGMSVDLQWSTGTTYEVEL